MTLPRPEAGTRERLIQAMAGALQRRGLHGVGLTELLTQADAPKGVLYHHFPGGKSELAIAAIKATSARVVASIDRLIATNADPLEALRGWVGMAQQQLERTGFERGCPLATVALETTPEDAAIRSALSDAFAAIRDRLCALLVGAGLAPDRARRFAALVLATYEGALMQARVAGRGAVMTESAALLLSLLQRELEETRPR